jgi:predicted O-linked N-acetylglucosamine transferase (SPINDLY family)
MANLSSDLGNESYAIEQYRIVLKLSPGHREALHNLGNAYLREDRLPEAAAVFERLLEVDPRVAHARVSLGVAYHMMGNYDQAIAQYVLALGSDDKLAMAHVNLSETLKDVGHYAEAIEHCRRAIKVEPGHTGARSNLLLISNYTSDVGDATILEEAREFGAVAAHRARAFSHTPNVSEAERLLRVGFVSGDLRSHAVGHFIEGAFSALARDAHERLQLVAYCTTHCDDAVSRRIRPSFHGGWNTVGDLNDEALAKRIREDEIDLLIDLSGHTAHNRLPMFAWKPAPVQATWLGYLCTTGLREIDYVIGDELTLPPAAARHFTEQAWRMADSYLCFTPPADETRVGPLPALANGFVTFGGFNNFAKVNEFVVSLWSKVLHAVPRSRLLLKSPQLRDAAFRDAVWNRFGVQGIDSDRLILRPPAPRGQYLATFNEVDIALDTYPYPGITTTVESLWMGVPVVTLAGESFKSRQGLGLLTNAGLPECVAATDEQFVEIAQRLAADSSRLADIRQSLRSALQASPVFDASRFSRDFEAAIRGMWREWCRSAR